MYDFRSAAAITPSDTASNAFDGLYCSATGTVAVVAPNSSGTVTFAMPAGTLLPVRTSLVKAATTATVIGLRR